MVCQQEIRADIPVNDMLNVNGQVTMGLNGHEESPQMAIELKK